MTDTLNDADLHFFCRQVQARSHEHRLAMEIVSREGWLSLEVGILRQELDSMVRVMYLLSTYDTELRKRLIHDAVSGQRWKLQTPNGRRPITDKMMVDAAEGWHGWAACVYKFGCSFIHLSELHDYQARDPFQSLPSEDRNSITKYLRQYHGAKASSDSPFAEIAPYLPKVLDKISSNLQGYLEQLRLDGQLRK